MFELGSSFIRSDRMGCICSINRRLQTTCEQLLLVKLRMSDLGHDVELLSNKISEIDDNLSHLIDMSHVTSQVKVNLDLVAGNLQRVERNTNSIGMEMVHMNSDHRSLRSSMRNMTTTIMKANCHHRTNINLFVQIRAKVTKHMINSCNMLVKKDATYVSCQYLFVLK